MGVREGSRVRVRVGSVGKAWARDSDKDQVRVRVRGKAVAHGWV